MVAAAERPNRNIAPEQLRTFKQDGCILIKGLLEPKWLQLLEDSIDDVVENTQGMVEVSGYHMHTFMWLWHDGFRKLFLESPLAYWASQLMEADRVNAFYDQLFVKEAGSPVPTPWHHDITFWPISGDKVVSAWISVDAVGPQESALQYVKGSHRWPLRFRAVTPDYNAWFLDSDLPMPPDFAEVERNVAAGKYELLATHVEPGDVFFFYASVLHGSFANTSQARGRRAASFRFVGDDVVFAPGHAKMFVPFAHGLKPGASMSGPIFPQILPALVPAEQELRDQGPIRPDPALLAAFQAAVQEALHRKEAEQRAEEP